MLVRRITVVKCDICSTETNISHEICGSSDGPFNNALAKAGWGGTFCEKRGGYIHSCKNCYSTARNIKINNGQSKFVNPSELRANFEDIQLCILKLVLSHIGIPVNTKTAIDRKRIQLSIYLCQVAGLDLGYSFNYWTSVYSTELKDVCENLHHGLPSDHYVLSPVSIIDLEKVKTAIKCPSDFNSDVWLEVLANYTYECKYNSKLTHKDIVDKLANKLAQTPNILQAPNNKDFVITVDAARDTLINTGILNKNPPAQGRVK